MSSALRSIHCFLLLSFLCYFSALSNENISHNSSAECGLNIPIPEDNCTVGLSYPFPISGFGNELGSNSALDEIRLIIDHNWELDLRMFLVSPAGTRVILSFENSTSSEIYSYGNPDAPNCEAYTSFTMDPCKADFPIDDEFITDDYIGTFFPEGDFADFDGEDPNGTWYLEICDKDSGANAGSLEFAELLLKNVYCEAPTGVYTSSITETGFELNWTSAFPSASSIVEVVEAGNNPGTDGTSPSGGNILSSNTGYLSLGLGLTPATQYDIFVRDLCTNGRYSGNTCALRIQTDCQVSAPTIYENFDSQTLCEGICGETCDLFGFWSNGGNDNFDWLVFQGPTESVRTGPSNDASFTGSGKYIYIESTNIDCRETSFASLESNCVYVTSNSNSCHMSFQYHMYGFGTGDLSLQILSEGASTWQDLWFLTGDQGDSWHKQFIDLSNYAGTSVQFRFISSNANNTTGDIALDEIIFYGPYENGSPSSSYFEDLDQDGFGDPGRMVQSCSFIAPQGYVNNNLDCDDSNPNVFPGNQEITCNDKDDNCNGMGDDAFVGNPIVYNQNICSNISTPIVSSTEPVGDIYWYKDSNATELLGVGDELSTSLNPGSHTIYAKDSITYGPGLRITEVELSGQFHLELQSVGVGADYTGWKVLVNSLVAGPEINDIVPSVWELSFLKRDQVITRGRNEWAIPIIWNTQLTGWAMIIDPEGIPMDIVFWNWSEEDLENFNFTYEGYNYNINNVPWWGPSFEVAGCSETSISLVGNDEKNFQQDYSCGASSIGNINANLNLTTHCSSELVHFNVNVFEAPIVTIDLDVDPCEASSITSAIDLTIRSGVGPYSYSWSNGAVTEDLIDLTPGNYSVTVTSVNGCQTIIDEISIGQNSSTLSLGLEEIEDVSCNGLEDGKVIVKVDGGPPPYQFNWSVGIERDLMSDTDTLDFLPRGNYEVTVTDNNGCTSDMIFEIVEPEEISVDVNVQKPTCQNSFDGGITISSGGGTDPLQFNWFDNSSSSEVAELGPGYYAVTIEDANGCLVILDQIPVQTDQDTIAIESIQIDHVNCHGTNTGAVLVEVVGGDKPLNFLWNDGSETNQINDLNAGNYQLTITDEKGCSLSIEEIIIFEPATEISLDFNTINTVCLGNCNGVAQAEVFGGKPPYTFEWENGSNNETVDGLCTGFIGLTIEDDAGCEYISQNQIFVDTDPTNFIVEVDTDSVRCSGEANGSIDLEVFGGVEPYVYNWDNAPDTQSPQGLIAGTYNCTVIDAMGCEYHIEEVNINTPDPLQIDLIEVVGSVSGAQEGSLEVSVTGGIDPYTINWYNAMGGWIDQGSKIENLNAGVYRIQMIDFNTCAAAIEGLEVPLLTSNSEVINDFNLNLYPNPVVHNLNYGMSLSSKPSNLQIQIVDILGRVIISEKVSSQLNGQIDTQGLEAGYYIFNVIQDGTILVSEAFVKG